MIWESRAADLESALGKSEMKSSICVVVDEGRERGMKKTHSIRD